MLHKNRITRSLCAVMLCAGLLFSGLLSVPAEAAPDDVNDVYAIDIEFGNLSFYYDYGVWNVNTMRYEADTASTYPADSTTAGFPGWYGFDDIANKIKISNGSQGSRSVTLSLSYRSLAAAELSAAGVTDAIGAVNMTVSNTPVNGASDVSTASIMWNGNSVTVPPNEMAVGYIHLSGEPVVADTAEAYASATMQPIGMLTLKIESWT